MASGHDIAMGLRGAYWSMHRQTNAHLAAEDATAEQFVVLSLLAERDGITQQELCRRATSDPNTIRGILVLLETRGLVARGRHPKDGRARSVTLTPKGRGMYRKLARHLKPLQDRLSALFQSAEAETLIVCLNRIFEAMTRAEPHRSTPSSATADGQA
jgi:DNA-binding MarR family transcriptional regulator